MAFQRGASAVGDDGNARLIAELQDAGDFFVAFGEHDDIGQSRVLHALAVAVVFAYGVRGYCALAVRGAQIVDRCRNCSV